MSFIFLVAGFIFLIKGADLLVDSASKLAKMLGVPAFIVGLSVVAFGTSAPEAAIGVISGIRQANEITFGNIVGSSIVNIGMVFGITSLILPVKIKKTVIRREIPLSLAIQALLAGVAVAGWRVSRIDGATLLIGFFVYILYIVLFRKSYDAKKKPNLDENIESDIELEELYAKGSHSIPKMLAFLIAGFAGLVVGGEIVTNSSINIASTLGLSETSIGLTVVAIGTSLPELVTSVTAAMRKEPEIAVGNVIGSNIFNALMVLGLSSLIHPIPVSKAAIMDLAVMLLYTVTLLALSLRTERVSRLGGAVLFTGHFLFIVIKL